MELLNFESIVAEAEKVIREYGEDFVYSVNQDLISNCSYFPGPDISTGCLFGVIMQRLNLPVLDEHEGIMANRLLRDFEVSLTDEQERLIVKAQIAQDCGSPWGRSLRILRGQE